MSNLTSTSNEVFTKIKVLVMKPDALQAGISASDAARTLGVTPAMAKEHLLSTESKGGQANGTSSQFEADSTNTTIFVGGLKPNVTDEDLRQQFSQYGEIVSVKIPIGKGCGFVQFAIRNNAEEALQKLNGTMIDK
ncbi:Polyadenylate-binding proteinC [Arachis hypogaea]|nr:Polyadenylate-binding proteinC [Arachis hypogaea]